MTVAPREISDDALLAMDHADWLETFSKLVMQSADVARDPAKAPQRLGMATRLRWAARVITLLMAENKRLKSELADLATLEGASSEPQRPPTAHDRDPGDR